MVGVNAHHDARLVVQRLEVGPDAQLGGERLAGRKAEKMPAVAVKAIASLAPEIGGVVRDDFKAVTLRRPSFRFIQPHTITSAEDRIVHVKPRIGASPSHAIRCTSDAATNDIRTTCSS